MKFKLLHSDLLHVTQAKALEVAGASLVGVFLPLLLLDKGLQLYQICLFYVAYSMIKLASDYFVTRAINRKGPRFGLLTGYTLSFAFTVMLSVYLATGSTTVLFVIPLVMGLRNTFLWSSEHLYVSKAMDTVRKSRDLATMSNITDGVRIVMPLFGGFIAVTFGTIWLTAIAAVIIAAALIPALSIRSGHEKYDNSLRFNLQGAPKNDLIANFGFGIHASVGVFLWPIYLAVFIPNFQSIGIVSSISAAIGIVVVQIIGRRGDKGQTSRVLIEGTGLSSLVHVGRLFAGSNPITITAVSSAYDVALGYQFNPWVSLYYSHTRRYGISYIMSMEIAGDLAYLSLWSVLAIVSYVSQSNSFFNIAFVGAAVGAWLCLLLSRDQQTG